MKDSVESQDILSQIRKGIYEQTILTKETVNSLVEMDTSLELINSLYEILDSQGNAYRNDLIKLRNSKKFLQISKEAHKLKSSFGSLGLTKLQFISKNLELECKKNDDEININLIDFLFSELESYYSSSMSELKDYINGFKSKEKAS
mgnify:FL=1